MKTVKAKLVYKGYQDPDVHMGNVEIAGRASRRSSHLQVISLGALGKWPLWCPDIKNACLQADGFDRDVYLRAPCDWNSEDFRRVWNLRAPAYKLNDAPAAFHRSLRKYLVNSVDLPAAVGLRFDVSSFVPRLYFVFRKMGSAVGAFATHTDDISGFREYDLLAKVRGFLVKRFGGMQVQEGSFVHVGMKLAQEEDFSVTLTQAAPTEKVKLLPTPPELWEGRKERLSMEYIKLRQCMLGELRWVATVSRPDMCAVGADCLKDQCALR